MCRKYSRAANAAMGGGGDGTVNVRFSRNLEQTIATREQAGLPVVFTPQRKSGNRGQLHGGICDNKVNQTSMTNTF